MRWRSKERNGQKKNVGIEFGLVPDIVTHEEKQREGKNVAVEGTRLQFTHPPGTHAILS